MYQLVLYNCFILSCSYSHIYPIMFSEKNDFTNSFICSIQPLPLTPIIETERAIHNNLFQGY